jgi:Fur family iron response transcriptional regulator
VLPVDGAAAVYDSNPAPHHHLFDVETGEVRDVPALQLQVLGLAEATAGLELAGVDVIVRVRGLATIAAPSNAPG